MGKSLNQQFKEAIRFLALLLFLGSLLLPRAHASTIDVKVGGYLFEPFVNLDAPIPVGLTLDLIQLFNEEQDKYRFIFIPTSPKRRYIDFERHVFDVMFFESKMWGWQEHDIEASNVFLKGGEVFIAKKGNKRNQSFFDDFSNKSIVGILGYHYGFADFNASESYLKKHFDILLVNSPQTIINQVLGNKADIGVVTISYLKKQLNAIPSYQSKLIISEKVDQEYEHTILVRDNFNQPSLKEINLLLDRVSRNGSLEKLLKKYGIDPLDSQ